ncbi:MAG: tetratricopeptide repeat protein [Candidatus Nitrosopolaris sp.]
MLLHGVARVLLLVFLGKYNEAVECHDKALEIDPNNDGAWNTKGLALYNLKIQ